MARRSIGVPLTVGIILMLLLVALAVGWQVLVWSDLEPLPRGLSRLDWVLLVLGTLFFGVVMVGLVWLCTWLIAEVRLNQRQRAFVDAVTHELKTPLSSFRLGLDTLSRYDLREPQRRRFLERMQADLDRLDETVESVLAAARAEERTRRGVIARPKSVDLLPLLEECVQRVAARHALPGSAVTIADDGPVMISGDAAELELVFGNLLDNAVKYSKAPVRVRVDIRKQGDGRVAVEIADRGMGIAARDLRRIFQRFYRAGREVQRQVKGLGLGLFVVRSLVKRQGGKVVARSEGAGLGSRFVVTLRTARGLAAAGPRRPDAPSRSRVAEAGESLARSGAGEFGSQGRARGEPWPES